MRPTIDGTMMEVAFAMAKRGTCGKRQVGCVLADGRGRILAAAYNGVPRGMPHCRDTGGAEDRACDGMGRAAGSDLCESVHAEQNALMQCRDPDAVRTVYVTVGPCMRCAKMLLNTGAERLVFAEPYGEEPQALELWKRAGRQAFRLTRDGLSRLF